MFIFKKLDKEKVEKFKRHQAEKTRTEIETHYLEVIRNMRIEFDRDMEKTVSELKKEHEIQKNKIICQHKKEMMEERKKSERVVVELQSIIKEKQTLVNDSQNAWAIINSHLPKMQHLSTKTRMFKEMKVSPYLDEYKEAQTIEDEWDSYIRSINRQTPKINKLLRMDKYN